MMKFSIKVISILLFATSTAYAQTPAGASIDLTGYSSTLVIDPSQPATWTSGELPWWGPYQLPPQPFTRSGMALSAGLPPNAAWNATVTRAFQSNNPAYHSPFWSGYYNEGEAYPNADTTLNLFNVDHRYAPISTTNAVIQLMARPISAAESATLPAQLSGRGYVSGAMNTYPHAQEYGYFETTAQVPSGPGFWSAFWMVPANMNPSCAAGVVCDTEIDVMEILGTNSHVLHSTLHTSDVGSSSYPSLGAALVAPNGDDLARGMHRYGVDWEPDFITFYLDGKAFYSAPTPADMHQPMYIIENLAVGTANTWAGAPTSSTHFPGVYSIEAIRAWASPNTVALTPAP